MDKFDERIKNAQSEYTPTSGFVDRTMDEVKKRKIHRRFSLKIWAPALAGGFAVLVMAVIFVPKPAQDNVVDGNKLPSHSQKIAHTVPTSSPAPISDGTDDAALAKDLSSIQDSMNQSGSDQSTVDTAVNDNQQAISILN
jgi:hypothetical protein